MNLKLKQQEGINSPKPTVKQEIRKIQGEINDIYTQKAQKNLIFLRQRYYEIGRKSAKYLVLIFSDTANPEASSPALLILIPDDNFSIVLALATV